jgi:hypothetical protein
MKFRLILFFFLSFYILPFLKAQVVYQHVSNYKIYDFLDELANLKIIQLNSAIKPYSRLFIAQKLNEAKSHKDMLSNRQWEDLLFFLKDYNKELTLNKKFNKRFDAFYYKDSIFTLSVNPIWGINYFTNENGNIYHRWGGGELFAYIGKNIGIYGSLRDNHETKPLELPSYFTQRTGAAYKSPDINGAVDYSEMRGGITYSNNWLTIGLMKDHFVWGNNYNGSNIFSGHTPSFAQVQMQINPVKWLTFNYVHGWLASRFIDSVASYKYNNGTRIVFKQKLLTANMLTVMPFKNLNVSLGNSIVYCDVGSNIGYLIPVFFYKSLDHTYLGGNEGGSNAQMFFDISSRQIKNLHLYTSFFFDELNISNMWKKDKQTNFISAKFGFNISLLKNFSFIAEYTRTNPITYKHFIPTTTFESDLFNLGHYLRDNSQDIYLAVKCKPFKKMDIQLAFDDAQHGIDYPYTGKDGTGLGLPFLSTIEWENKNISLKTNYQLINDLYIFLEYIAGKTSGNIKTFSPPFFYGTTNTLSFGFNYGF